MLSLRLRRPSPALVIACIALFVALSGTGYAVVNLPRNSVGPKQLKKNAVTSPKVKNNALTGADVNEGTLGQVPSAASAANADTVDGLDSAAFARSEGLMLVSVPWQTWEIGLGDTTALSAENHSGCTRFYTSGAALNQSITATPVIPLALHGKRTRVLGAEICYAATSIGDVVILDIVGLQVRRGIDSATAFDLYAG